MRNKLNLLSCRNWFTHVIFHNLPFFSIHKLQRTVFINIIIIVLDSFFLWNSTQSLAPTTVFISMTHTSGTLFGTHPDKYRRFISTPAIITTNLINNTFLWRGKKRSFSFQNNREIIIETEQTANIINYTIITWDRANPFLSEEKLNMFDWSQAANYTTQKTKKR